MKKMIARLSLTIIGLLLLATATANAQPAPNYSYIYGIGNDGALKWYRHTGAATGAGLETPGAWLGANEVGTGWNGFVSVFPGGLNTIYLIRADGRLEWRQHKGASDGLNQWAEGKTVGRGWDGFKQVFSVGGGIIYVIEPGGKLRWYKHNGYQTGASMETPGAWEGPKEVGRGWADFKQVFPGGNGIIYAITQDGKLRWYKHNGYLTGAGMETPGAWEGPNEVGRGWADFQNVFSAGNGIIYAITQDGKLRWYKHNGYLTGAGMETPGAWENPKEIGRGWGDLVQVFALLPGSSSISRIPSSADLPSNSDSASDPCTQWDVNGQWTFVHSGGYSPRFTLKVTETGIQGSASSGYFVKGSLFKPGYWVGINGTVQGTINGGSLELYLKWENTTEVYIYSGEINPQGRIEGSVYAEQNPDAKSNWYSDRFAKCLPNAVVTNKDELAEKRTQNPFAVALRNLQTAGETPRVR